MEPPTTTRELAAAGVESRLTHTLVGIRDIELVPTPVRSPYLPEAACPPGEPAQPRVLRAVTLRGATGAFAAVAGVWRAAGLQVTEPPEHGGLLLTAVDPDGYILVLGKYPGGEPVLTVASPLIRAQPAGPLVVSGMAAGLMTGAGVGFLGPCLGALFGPHRLAGALGAELPFFLFLPFLLVVGAACLVSESTRRFGTGLLIGGTGVGVVIAGACTAGFPSGGP